MAWFPLNAGFGLMTPSIPFDPEWMRSEIARHRAVADAWELILNDYLGNTSSRPATTNRDERRPVENRRGGPRQSKYEPVFQQYEKTGGALTIQDMIDIAAAMGVEIGRDNMRSIVWTQKEAGRAHPSGEGYVWGVKPAETATPETVLPPPGWRDSSID
jgi:hypothetical protein